jgi:hypothetical protein
MCNTILSFQRLPCFLVFYLIEEFAWSHWNCPSHIMNYQLNHAFYIQNVLVAPSLLVEPWWFFVLLSPRKSWYIACLVSRLKGAGYPAKKKKHGLRDEFSVVIADGYCLPECVNGTSDTMTKEFLFYYSRDIRKSLGRHAFSLLHNEEHGPFPPPDPLFT